MKGEEQPLRSTSKVVIPQPGLNLNGATKNQKEKRIGMLTVNSVSAFPLSSVIEFACNWILLCKSLSQKVSSWL